MFKTEPDMAKQTAKNNQSLSENRVISLAAAVGDLKAHVDDMLPEGQYVKVDHFTAALSRLGRVLAQMSEHPGTLVVDRQQASTLIVSLLLVQSASSPLLEEDHSIQALLKLDAKELATAVKEVKRLIKNAHTTQMDFLSFQRELETTRNPAVSRRVLPFIGPDGRTVVTSAGPIDLSCQQKAPSTFLCEELITVDCTIARGLDESTRIFEIRTLAVQSSEFSLIHPNRMYRIELQQDAHRTAILLGQLLKAPLRVTVQIVNASILPTRVNDLTLLLEGVHLAVKDPDLLIQGLAEQLTLDFSSEG